MSRRDEKTSSGIFYDSSAPKPVTDALPYRGVDLPKSWQGPAKVKPWDRSVTVAIPFLDVSELLDTFVECWQLQSIPVNLVIIDTGSSPRHMGYLDELERVQPEIEIHRLRFKSVKHPSDPVAIAMDLAFSLCTTKYLFATHADCFPARRDLIEWMIQLREREDCPVVGYQITDRGPIRTDGWVGHTATLFDMEAADRLNLCWSQRRYCNLTGMDHFGNNRTSGYPDTEFLINEQLDRAGVARHIIGKEENFVTTDDENIIHVRSYGSSKLYSPQHFERATPDMADALRRTHERIREWKEK